MTSQFRYGVSALIAAMVAGLVACGGGGGGSSTLTSSILNLKLSDPFTAVLIGDGTGLWVDNSGGGGDGGGDGGGGAGDGEFVKVSMLFPNTSRPTGTLTWTILRSQYGKTNATGTLTIQKDASAVGGYKVTEVNGVPSSLATQGNFFVSTSGQLSGTLPLPIGTGGAIKNSLFSGFRFKDIASAPTDMSDYAGQYGFGIIDSNLSGAPFTEVDGGQFTLNADGSGRICPQTFIYSTTCANGINVKATFDDPSSRNLVHIKETATQGTFASGHATGIDMLAVVRKFGSSGVSFSGDAVFMVGGAAAATGAVYGSRLAASPADPTTLIGAWNYTYTSISNNASLGSASNQVAIANVGGAIKVSAGTLAGCNASSNTISAGPVNGVFQSLDGNSNQVFTIQLDTDFLVVVTGGAEIGFARRYSADPANAPCQPG